MAVTGPNNENYILQDLHPFSNYSIKIRAYNKDNLPSEDSDAKFQATLSGGKILFYTYFFLRLIFKMPTLAIT